MKRIQFFFLFMVAIMSFVQGYSDEAQKLGQVEKIYVHLDQVSLTTNGIFVNLNNQWQPVESLHVDERGFYISDNLSLTWRCRKCGYDNAILRNVCKNCGDRPCG